MAKKHSKDEIWEAAKFIWENTPNITDRELIVKLEAAYGEDAPKSNGSISKRRSKYEWEKKPLANGEINHSKKEPKHSEFMEKGNQNSSLKKLVPSKTNKAQNQEPVANLEAKGTKIEQLTQEVVVKSEQKAALIIKTRQRLASIGDVTDSVIDIIVRLVSKAFDDNTDPEEIQKALVLSDSLSNTAERVTKIAKMLAEVELPLSGVSQEDFSQSEQDRRLGMLEALGNINAEEDDARERLTAELNERLEWIKETANSGDFGRTPTPDDDDVEDIDYTAVDD